MARKRGCALKVKEIKKFIEQSSSGGTYNDKPVYDYVVDHELTNNFVHVYYNPNTGKAVVVNRGSATFNDAITDIRLMFNTKEIDRFGISKITIEKVFKKYGANNVTILGSSLGGLISEDYGDNAHNIIIFNKAVPPSEIKKKIPKNQYDIRTKNDIVSFLSKFQKHENPVVTIPSKSINPIKEHLYPTLDRLDPDQLIGSGKKPTVKELKDYIKKHRKASGQKILITGLKKRELYEIAQSL